MECCLWDEPACCYRASNVGCGSTAVRGHGSRLGKLLSVIDHMKLIRQLYLLAVPLHRAPSTPPWSLVIIYALSAILGISQIAMRFYVKRVTGHYPAWSTGLWLGLQLFQIIASIATLSIIAGLHMAPPVVLARMVRLGLATELIDSPSWLQMI
jgi:hypothetical protein